MQKNMKLMLFIRGDGQERKISDSYSVRNYVTADHCENVSLAVGNAKNHIEETESSSDRIYYILEGNIRINQNVDGWPGDVIYIPMHTPYLFEGTFTAVIVNSPAFQPQDEMIKKISAQ